MQIPLKMIACAALLSCLGAFLPESSCGQPAPLTRTAVSAEAPGHESAAEAGAARAYQEALRQGPPAVYAFLHQFPKGADLHVHLSGAVYAETFIHDAGEDGLCVDPAALRIVAPPCQAPLVPAARLDEMKTSGDQDLYDRLIDSLSMRSFVPTSGWSGHDQFFATFARFGPIAGSHMGEWVDEVASRAANQNQQYLELMDTPAFSHAAEIGTQLGWNPELDQGDRKAFARLRRQLLDHGLRDEVTEDRNEIRAFEEDRKRLEHCGTAQAAPACRVEIRYIYQVLRGNPPARVFAQTLLGFETVQASMDAHDDGFVGINFVMPEDGFLSMRDYTLQMKMVSYLHSVYPNVHITLHAGELAPGMVPPEGLRFHIRQAVELGHAERIGHGVDIMYEDDAQELLREMATKHIMIEINLSSNEGILGIKGDQHPFPIYLAAHVPVALSTDDEGVSRIEITHEYTRAAVDYRLTYRQLKLLARTGMEHDFLPGESLWAKPDEFSQVRNECRGQVLGGLKPSNACKTLLDGSEKAAAQWDLERRFREFEATF